MSKRAVWTEFDKDTRKYLKKRDNDHCVICGTKGALQCMHIFLSRAHGGHGCKENGVEGCVICHKIIDNPIGEEENRLNQQYINKARAYLIEKENIVIDKAFMDSLRYKKEIIYAPTTFVKPLNRCEDCSFIRNNKFNNSSIPSYYCIIKRQIIGKKNDVCKDFKGKKVE